MHAADTPVRLIEVFSSVQKWIAQAAFISFGSINKPITEATHHGIPKAP